MKYQNSCGQWKIKDFPQDPQRLLEDVLRAVLDSLPCRAPGFAKCYAEYPAGVTFGWTSLDSPGIFFEQNGRYLGGEIRLSVALASTQMDQPTLALLMGQIGCGLRQEVDLII